MIYISHRGNIDLVDRKLENSPGYIRRALSAGYDVEIDVWVIGEDIFLGHDEPQYETDLSFLKNPGLWCHAKNLAALDYMVKNKVHCFWHQRDDYTLTSDGLIWTYPGKPVTSKSVVVLKSKELQESYVTSLRNCHGICTDNIEKVKDILS